jgi:hypothetical protein
MLCRNFVLLTFLTRNSAFKLSLDGEAYNNTLISIFLQYNYFKGIVYENSISYEFNCFYSGRWRQVFLREREKQDNLSVEAAEGHCKLSMYLGIG